MNCGCSPIFVSVDKNRITKRPAAVFLAELLEGRTLLTSVTILSDSFTDGPAYSGKNISGRTPSVTDLPGSTYQLASGFDYDQQVLGRNNGTYSNAAYFHNLGSTSISLASNGSYGKPALLQLSAKIAFDVSTESVSVALLGFYSSVPAPGNQNDNLNFTGLQLNSNGNVTLILNGTVGATVAFAGTYTPGTYISLVYSVDTLTGSIFGVSLTGSSSDYTIFSTNQFTNSATSFAGIGGDSDSSRVHFSSFKIETVATAVAGKGVAAQPLGNVTINSGNVVTIPTAVRQADRNVILANSLTIAGSRGTWLGQLDLTDNDLIVHDGNLTDLTDQIASGFYPTGGVGWTGNGIISSASAAGSVHLTALGIELNSTSSGQPIYGSGTTGGLFDGQNPSASDVLIKYTYYGDANLDGTVDGSDYSKIDYGFINHLTGWSNGDFNYDGVVDGSDYTLIDNAFNSEGTNLSAPIPVGKLAFESIPTSILSSTVISPPIAVDVEDLSGNKLLTDSSVVTLSIGTGSGSLAGTTSVAAVNGVATFSNLAISQAGTFTLVASDASVFAQSPLFLVTAKSSAGGLTSIDPFGVSASYQSTTTYASWAPQVASAGAKWVRLFPTWSQVEPTQDVFDWSSVDAVTSTAAANGQFVSGLLYYNVNWVNSNTGTFPTNNLSAWSSYVSAVIAHTAGKVEYWEVWNEPENFSSGGTAQDYANVDIAAYNAAKAADPNAKIGLGVASVDLNYLEQTIEDGAANHFDFVTVHPYEVLAAVDQGWEGDYISIVPTIRKMLSATDPEKATVPIWFTELGEQIGSVNGPITVTAASQAQDLVKAFTMGIAEGVARIDWYQGEDDSGDSGYGLLDSNGNPTPSYTAFSSMTNYLGSTPSYLGWVQPSGADDAFVFQGANTTVMAAWAPPGTTDNFSFSANVQIVNPVTGVSSALTAGATLSLTSAPMLIIGVPTDLVSLAETDAGQPFPWGGNYSNASSVSIQLGSVNTDSGLHQLNANQTSQGVTVYGGAARLVNDSGQDLYQSFEVDPNFISYSPPGVNITIIARRDTNNDSAGLTIGYESTTGLLQQANAGVWTIPGNDQWYSYTFSLTDAEFDSKWGFNFFINSGASSSSEFYIQSITLTKNS
jgi:hypothetical protein